MQIFSVKVETINDWSSLSYKSHEAVPAQILISFCQRFFCGEYHFNTHVRAGHLIDSECHIFKDFILQN